MNSRSNNETAELHQGQDMKNNPDQLPINDPLLNSGVRYPRWRMYFTVVVLLLVYLLNYMDRYTVSAILTEIKRHYEIDNKWAGLLQTVFILVYVVFALLAGYVGDRFNRKWIMIWGVFVWIAAVIASSMIDDGWINFKWFLIARGFVGAGEGCFSVLAPTVISDLFTSTTRSFVLMAYYVAAPLGSGLGFISARGVTDLMKDHAESLGIGAPWQWGLRVTPIFGAICLVLMMIFVLEPERGYAERIAGATKLERSGRVHKDLWYLLRHPTFITETLAFTVVTFVIGAISFWFPTAFKYAICISLLPEKCHPNGNSTILSITTAMVPPSTLQNDCNNVSIFENDFEYPSDQQNVDLIFGGITCAAGFIGVILGTLIAMYWKSGKHFFRCCKTIRADAILCALGSCLAIGPMVGSLDSIRSVPWLAWMLLFAAITCLYLNRAIITDILMYTIIPNRRCTAAGVQMAFYRLFGDAPGPYIVGAVADAIKETRNCPDDFTNFDSFRIALYLPVGAAVISAIIFTATIFVVKRDVEKCEAKMGKMKQPGANETSPSEAIGQAKAQE